MDESKPPIDVQAAVHRAKDALSALYADDPPGDVALEEIELVKESTRELWAVTLGFHRQRSVKVQSSTGFGFQLPSQIENRVYKTIFVDARTGEFVKMDIRQVQ